MIVRSDGRADLQLRQPGRRHPRPHHARDPRRGSRLEHADADQHPARARRRPAGVRARPEHHRRRRARSSRSGTARCRSTTFRDDGYCPAALMNFLALLGWSYDDKTTIMSRHELIERFSLERVVPSPATFDYEKLDWMNGVYLRALQPDEYAQLCSRGCTSTASTGRSSACARRRRSCRRRSRSSRSTRTSSASCSSRVAARRRRRTVVGAAADRLDGCRPGTRPRSRTLARAGRGARGEAAHGVRADSPRGHRVEGVAGAVREPRAARARRVARRLRAAAPERSRPRERVERRWNTATP